MPTRKQKTQNSSSKDKNSKKSSSEVPLDEFAGFKILPLHVQCTSSPDGFAIHYLYIKRHEDRKENLAIPQNRTLFVVNVPIDATELHFRQLFKPYGRIESVEFREVGEKEDNDKEDQVNNGDIIQDILAKNTGNTEKKNKKGAKKKKETKIKKLEKPVGFPNVTARRILSGGAHAYIVFLEEIELERALSMQLIRRTWSDGSSGDMEIPPIGLQRYLDIYRLLHPPAEAFKSHVDSYMEWHAAQEAERDRAIRAIHNKPDEDGFILVTRKGRRAHNSDGTVTVTAARRYEVEGLKPKNKELQNFYRFQLKEKKRNELMELRKRFEEDKRKIEILKANRRFKPY